MFNLPGSLCSCQVAGGSCGEKAPRQPQRAEAATRGQQNNDVVNMGSAFKAGGKKYRGSKAVGSKGLAEASALACSLPEASGRGETPTCKINAHQGCAGAGLYRLSRWLHFQNVTSQLLNIAIFKNLE